MFCLCICTLHLHSGPMFRRHCSLFLQSRPETESISPYCLHLYRAIFLLADQTDDSTRKFQPDAQSGRSLRKLFNLIGQSNKKIRMKCCQLDLMLRCMFLFELFECSDISIASRCFLAKYAAVFAIICIFSLLFSQGRRCNLSRYGVLKGLIHWNVLSEFCPAVPSFFGQPFSKNETSPEEVDCNVYETLGQNTSAKPKYDRLSQKANFKSSLLSVHTLAFT